MTKKIIFILPFIVLITDLFAQSDNSNLRPAFELKLSVNRKQFYSSPFAETKYIINDSIIQIFPGEKLLIEADTSNNKLVNLKKVSEISNPNKTLIMEFIQETEGRTHKYMQLVITNPFNKKLHYKALMNLMQNEKWVNTSVVPIMPKLKSIEMWPDILTSLALSGFNFKEK